MKQARYRGDPWTVDDVVFLVLETGQWAAILGLLALFAVLTQ